MSVIVAVRQSGVVYFGSDTQTSSCGRKSNQARGDMGKVVQLPGGIFVGAVGRVVDTQRLLTEPGLFDFGEQVLTTEYIYNTVIPKIRKILRVEGDKHMEVSLLIAQNDRLYQVDDDFIVMKICNYTAIGSGREEAMVVVSDQSKPTRERILSALRYCDKHDRYIGAPFELIDTQNKVVEVVEK